MANVAPPGLNQFFDNNGNPLALGTISTFDAGTATPRLTWSDAGETSANANPLTLDAAGRAQIFYRGDYKLVGKDVGGATLWTVDHFNVPDIGVTAASVVADLANASNALLGDAMVASKRSESGAGATTVHAINQARPLYVPADFLGSTFTAALQSALASGATVIEMTSSGTITAQCNVPANVIIKGDGYAISKGFNGDMFTMADGSELHDLRLPGNGATWTGRGVLISAGADQRILNCDIFDMESYCVEFSGANSGGRCEIKGGFYQRTNFLNAAIKLPASESLTEGTRYISNIFCGGGVLIDPSGGNMTFVSFCNGAIGPMSSTTKQLFISNSRVGGLTLDGGSSPNICACAIGAAVVIVGTCVGAQLTGNNIAGSVTLNAGATLCRIDDSNNVQSGIIDNSASPTNFLDDVGDFTPTIGSDTGVAAVGNGTLTGRYNRRGRSVRVEIQFILGSTSTMGTTGTFFTMPAGILNQTVKKTSAKGSIYALDSGTGTRAGTTRVIGAAAPKIYMASDGVANPWNATIPITWGVNDVIELCAEWEIG